VILHKIEVPSQVLNGSLPYVILDCQYSLNLSERGGGQMVLKWYRDGRNIYQWIPPAHPRASRNKLSAAFLKYFYLAIFA
jgi:hypothetical protein